VVGENSKFSKTKVSEDAGETPEEERDGLREGGGWK